MYHGTSSKFLPKIFQMGIIPEPTEGKWKNDDLEQDASAIAHSLRSLKGSYWTDNIMLAYMSARRTVRNQGGDPMLVIAQIVRQSALADEDNVVGPIQRAYQQSLIPYFGARDVSDTAWSLQGIREADPKEYKKIASDFAQQLHDILKTSDKMPIDKNKLLKVFEATHERLLGHVDVNKGWTKTSYIDLYDHWLSKQMDWKKAIEIAREKVNKNDIPTFDKISGERGFTNALDYVSKRYKKSALQPKDGYGTLRVTEQVGFSGRNKIVAMTIILPETTHVHHAPDQVLQLVYGHLPSNFISDWRTNWGSKFKIVDRKSERTLYNTSS